jgi:uncharacterized membrane protein YgdD (TMEM256/DUF423 family)
VRSIDQIWFAAGAVVALIGVALGAFAAHALRARLSADSLAIFETGVRYQMYHAFALLAAGYAAQRWQPGLVAAAGALFLLGVVLFSGSLYALALSGVRVLGAITPFGGLAFIAGWLLLALAAIRG